MSPGAAVLAVDGGGAKTDLALVAPDGELLALVRGGATQAHYLGAEGAVAVVADLLRSAVERAGLAPPAAPVASVGSFLLAGADLPEETAALRARLERERWAERLLVDNDTVALLRAGTERGWGVAVVCGAGINCLGVAPGGQEVRFPSLGEISGDWGGGGDLGRAALFAAARSADGRGPRTALEASVPAHFGLAAPVDVARAVHLGEMPRARLAELAPLVLSSAGDDAVAAGLVERLAGEVIGFARAALGRLELTAADPDVVLGGGVLRAAPPDVIAAIAEGVTEVAPAAHVLVSASEPVVGAVLLGLDALGAEAEARRRARAQLDAAVEGRVAPPVR